MKLTAAVAVSLWALLGGTSACRPRSNDLATRPELAIVRADSEVFEAVIKWYLTGNGKEYPFKLTAPQVDERPTGAASGFRSAAGMSHGVQAKTDSTATDGILETLLASRRRILARMKVPAGRPFNAPDCGGILAPPPRPGEPDSSAHARCPKESQVYVVIQLPTPGVPAYFNTVKKGQHAPAVDTTGEVWTVVTSVASVGPRGQMWDQHAWVFRRDPFERRLKLLSTLLLAIAE